MKICNLIAGFLSVSAIAGWSDPTVEWTTLRIDWNTNDAFCAVQVHDLQDLQLTERAHAYATFYVGDTLSWMVYLGKISPQTEVVGTLTHAPWREVDAWDRAEIVICPLNEVCFGYENVAHVPAEKFRTPISRPKPKSHFNFSSPSPHQREQWEAQDARAEEPTTDMCKHQPAPCFKPPANRPSDSDGTFRRIDPRGHREACEAKDARLEIDTRDHC